MAISRLRVCDPVHSVFRLPALYYDDGLLLMLFNPVLPPISTKDLSSSDVDKLTQDTRDSMLQALTDFYKGREGAN